MYYKNILGSSRTYYDKDREIMIYITSAGEFSIFHRRLEALYMVYDIASGWEFHRELCVLEEKIHKRFLLGGISRANQGVINEILFIDSGYLIFNSERIEFRWKPTLITNGTPVNNLEELRKRLLDTLESFL